MADLWMFSKLPCREDGSEEQARTSGVFFSSFDLCWSISRQEVPSNNILIQHFAHDRLGKM